MAELYVCGGDAALCQITLTTCYSCYYYIRLHQSTMYVDATYCYRQSSVVCLTVGLSQT